MKIKTNSILKILSLGVGLALGIVLIAKVCFELSYDRCFKDSDRIYAITTGYSHAGQEEAEYDNVSGGVAPGFVESVPGAEKATRYTFLFDSGKFFTEDKNVITGDLLAADSCFFEIFDRPFLAGDPLSATCGWSGEVAVSRTFAEKLGGVNEAIGKTVIPESMPKLTLNVVGVFEDYPDNCSVKCDLLVGISAMGKRSIDNWMGNDRYRGFVRLAEGTDPASLKGAIRAMQLKHQDLEQLEKNGTKLWYNLVPFQSKHVRDSGTRSMIYILAIVAFLIILISVMNYVLIAVSDVVRRSKEMGVRKCYGAEGRNIYGMLFGETAVNLLAALALALIVVFAFRGSIESITGASLASLFIPQTIWTLACVAILVFLVSAIVPAAMFDKVPVSQAFRNFKDNKRRWKLSLLFVQFAIDAFMISLVLVAGAQYSKIVGYDPGYGYKNLVYFELSGVDIEKKMTLADEFRKMPEVEGAELAYCLPLEGSSGNNIYLPEDVNKELFNIADQYGATDGFFDLMGFRLVEGAAPHGPLEVAVSEKFVTEMKKYADWSDGAVGKEIFISEHNGSAASEAFTICGVYKDYLIGGADRPDTRPSIRFVFEKNDDWLDGCDKLVVKLRSLDSGSVEKLAALLKRVLPDSVAEPVIYKEKLRSLYDTSKNVSRLFLIGAIFSIIIALLGLIGYVRDESERRSAEIAVRKVNGAQSGEIVRMFVIDILKICIIAAVLGDICAWFVARRLLEMFAVKITAGPLYFIAADIVIIVAVVVTTVLNSLRVSRRNPVDSLKNN